MKRTALFGALAILLVVVLCVAGCHTQTVKQQESSQPIGYKAISAMAGTAQDKANQSIRTMSNEDKIGQLLMVHISGTHVQESTKDIVRKYRPGGIIIDNTNIESKQQLRSFIKNLDTTAQVSSLVPLFMALDRESIRGGSNSLLSIPAPARLSELGLDVVSSYATRSAIELRDIGINVNLGPTMNTDSMYSYDSDPNRVTHIGQIIGDVYATNHVMVAYKYFPGGVTASTTKEELNAEDIPIFQQVTHQPRTSMLMVNPVLFSAIDANHVVPTSKIILTDWLRHELQFSGLILSDHVEIGAAVTGIDIGAYAVQSILAGSDILIINGDTYQMATAYTALQQAVQNGTISQERLDESVRRIMEAKYTTF